MWQQITRKRLAQEEIQNQTFFNQSERGGNKDLRKKDFKKIEYFNQSENKSICNENSLSIQFVLKMQRCDICSKSFANRKNLNRHRKKIHGLNKNEHELFCSSCDSAVFNSKTLLEMQVHLSSQHNGKPSRICVYCKKTFTTESDFRKHLREQHSLPMRNQTDKKDDRNFSSAFNNTFKIFKIEAEDKHDLLEFLLEKETLIRETLMEYSQRKPVEVQLSVKLILQKPFEEDADKIENHLNTDMIPVFAQGLAKETFFEMIDKLLSTLISFTAHGSGWDSGQNQNCGIKMANFAPVRG